MKLRALAHARTGDKGNTVNISVIAHDPADFPRLVSELTTERVAIHLGTLAAGDVERHLLPQLHALNFVVHNALAGGVTKSLALDAHGKALSTALLSLEID